MTYHPITEKIASLLRGRGMWFETFEHEAVRTSEEAAAIRPNYTPKQGTKALIVRVKENGEKKFVMVVVPGNARFDPKKLKKHFGLSDIRFATEEEIAKITDGVLPGGVPPFGNLFNLPVYCDEKVFTNEKIIFNAGDRSFSIGMYAKDFGVLISSMRGNIT